MPETRSLRQEVVDLARNVGLPRRLHGILERRAQQREEIVRGENTPEDKALARAREAIADLNQQMPDSDIRTGALIKRTFEPSSDIAERPLPTEPSEKIAQELRISEKMRDPLTGQEFGFIMANRESFDPDKPVVLNLPLYGNEVTQANGTIREDEVWLRTAQLAHHMPGMTVMAIDYPLYGTSDKLRKTQRSTKAEDSFVAIADAQLRAMKEMGLKKLHITGQSMGAFVGVTLAMQAATHGIEVENVLLYESPGVVEMPFWKLGKNFLQEFGALDRFSAFPYNPGMVKASHLSLSNLEGLKLLVRTPYDMWWRKDPFLRYARAMAKNVVQTRAAAVLSSQDALREETNSTSPKTKIFFINGRDSTISPVDSVKNVAQALRSSLPEDEKNRVRVSIYPGESHLPMIHPQRYAADALLRITGKPYMPAA